MKVNQVSIRDVEKRLRKDGWRKEHKSHDSSTTAYTHPQYTHVVCITPHMSARDKLVLFEKVGWDDWCAESNYRERVQSAVAEMKEAQRQLGMLHKENHDLRIAMRDILDMVDRLREPATCACGDKITASGGRCADCVQRRRHLHAI